MPAAAACLRAALCGPARASRSRLRCCWPPEDAARLDRHAARDPSSARAPEWLLHAVAAAGRPGGRVASRICCPMPAPWRLLAAEPSRPPHPLQPLYLRPPDVKPQADKSLPRATHDRCRSTTAISALLWASPEHAAELAELHARLFDAPWDADSFSRLLEHPGSTAVPGPGRPAATDCRASSSASSPPTRPRSSRSAWRKDGQRHGIARQLVEGLCRAARRPR